MTALTGPADAVTPATTSAADTVDPAITGPCPPARLWAQTHALRAMADLLDRLNIPGLSVVFDPGRITVQVSDDLGSPDRRTQLVRTLADAIGTGARLRPGVRDDRCNWMIADGDLAGHPIHVFTELKETP